MTTTHDRAQELAAQAGVLFAARQRADARRLYAEAAQQEGLALRDVPADKPRTRSILAVSYVSLLYKSAQYGDAEREVYRALAREDLLPFGRVQLRELLEVILDEQAIPAGYQYSGDEVVITLRGSEVGFGTAPFDLVLQKGSEFKTYMTRVMEFNGRFPFRKKGPAPAEVVEALKTRATQPIASSYKFSLRVVEPAQIDMYEAPRIPSAAAVETALEVLRLANSGTQRAQVALCEVVPDAEYRSAMLKLVRNLTPADPGLRELEVSRRDTSEGQMDSVLLGPGSADRVREVIHFDRPPDEEPSSVVRIAGVLRALHLDRRWLELVRDNGKVVRCKTPADALDDVLGPMVNRSVVVNARQRPSSSGTLELLDIELSGR